MHEFSIAEGIVEAVVTELDELGIEPARLRQVHLEIGKMRQIIPETLEFAFQQMAAEKGFGESELAIEVKPVSGTCSECSWQGELEEMLFVCPECGSRKLEITGGKELQLTTMEYEDI